MIKCVSASVYRKKEKVKKREHDVCGLYDSARRDKCVLDNGYNTTLYEITFSLSRCLLHVVAVYDLCQKFRPNPFLRPEQV